MSFMSGVATIRRLSANTQPQPSPTKQASEPSIQRFARIPFNPFDEKLPDRAWRLGEFGERWLIEFDSEKCILPNLRGCGLLHRIICCKSISSIELLNVHPGTSAQIRDNLLSCFPLISDDGYDDVDHEAYHVTGDIKDDFLTDLRTCRELNRAYKDAQLCAREAWGKGATEAEIDRLSLEVIEIRKYMTQTIGLHARRRVPTQLMRDTHAIRSALDYVFQVLRRQKGCPKTARHLSAHVRLDHLWQFTDSGAWDLEPLPAEWSVPDQKICVLGDDEATAWIGSTTRPGCGDHQHTSAARALWMIKNNEETVIRWAGKHAIWMSEVRYLTTVYVDCGELGGPGMPVMQVVPMAAPIFPAKGKYKKPAE